MLDNSAVITHSDPKSSVSEAYRVLRTNIQYSCVDKQMKTIVVTSSDPMEGKTTTVANLAVTFAQAGNKVLLIDSDLRKPRIHKLFGVSGVQGLTNLIAAHEDYKKYVQKCDVPDLYILPCGTIAPNPSELLASNAMRQFMKDIYNDYDYIFMDAPPVGSVTDAAIISTFVDGTILVANSGRISSDAVKKAKASLVNVNANVFGVVLNNLDKGLNKEYYKYNYYDKDKNVKRSRKNKKSAEEKPVNMNGFSNISH